MSSGTITITPLYSGSSGNAILMSTEDTHILVDAGMSCKKIVEALTSVALAPEDISAILITHDHSDHISALDVFTRKYARPVYATRSTWRGIHAAEKKPHPEDLDHEITPGEKMRIGQFDILAFDTPHDATGSCGYRFETKDHRAAIATDIGIMTDVIFENLRGCEGILLEANYDYDMLWNGGYPYYLKKRIAGNGGHLCNDDCASTIAKLCKAGTRHFILGHLSAENNLPQVAERTVLRAMETEKLIRDVDYTLRIASRYQPTAPLTIGERA